MRGAGRLGPLVVVLALVALTACGDDTGAATDPATPGDDPGAGEPGDYRTLLVGGGGDYETIQAAVDDAEPGDLVLVSPGVYHEAVTIETDRVVLRGLDRNETILDGEFDLDNGVRVVGANGVAVENLTARHFARNGFFWTGVDGYRGSYLTAHRNGSYGIYAFDSVNGLLEQSFASGSADGGFYIGQCFPCHTVIDDVVSEYNGLGFSGTNAGGDLTIVNSTFRYNRVGVVPSSGSYELCYPQREATIVGNLVYGNNQPDTPAISAALLAMGNGILAPGGHDNVIERNRVWDHDIVGIGLVPFPEEDAVDLIPDEWLPCDEAREQPVADPEDIPATLLWPATGNVVRDNDVSDSRIADLGVNNLGLTDTPQGGNCFAGNTFETSGPVDVEAQAPCEGEPEGDFDEGAVPVEQLIARERPGAVDYAEAPTPEPPLLDSMPDAADAPPVPADGPPPAVDVDAIGLPPRPDGT